MNKQTFIIRYAEIGLKGRNRPKFENYLVTNIKRTLRHTKASVIRQHGQIIVSVSQSSINHTIEQLSKVFGIAWFAPVQVCSANLIDISSQAIKLAKPLIKPSHTFAIVACRAQKNLPYTSQDIQVQAGQAVRLATKARVNLDQPQHTIYIVVENNHSYLYTTKYPGSGGLPVGTSGKLLSLLSGGFDSIAASYSLAKRGAQVDFLHFHVFPNSHQVVKSKIHTISTKLQAYTQTNHLHLASYAPYQLAVLGLTPSQQKQELILFRRLMVRVGELLADQYGYQALVLGDSLGQVASQTLENLVAVDSAVSLPLFRPLIGQDKQDITDFVVSLGFEAAVNQPYQDCCSLVAKHPTTIANLNRIFQIEQQLNADSLAQQLASQIETVRL